MCSRSIVLFPGLLSGGFGLRFGTGRRRLFPGIAEDGLQGANGMDRALAAASNDGDGTDCHGFSPRIGRSRLPQGRIRGAKKTGGREAALQAEESSHARVWCHEIADPTGERFTVRQSAAVSGRPAMALWGLGERQNANRCVTPDNAALRNRGLVITQYRRSVTFIHSSFNDCRKQPGLPTFGGGYCALQHKGCHGWTIA